MATGALSGAAEAAGGDDADLRAIGRENLGALAHRRAARRLDADALARRAVLKLLQDALVAEKAAVRAARLARIAKLRSASTGEVVSSRSWP